MISHFDIRNSAFGLRATPNFGRRPALRKFDFRLSTFNFSNHLTSNHLDPVARVTICTIQRLYAMLRSSFSWLNKGCNRAKSREEAGRALCEFNEACGPRRRSLHD